MQAYEYIDPNIPYLKASDTVETALDIMAGNAVTELPVISEKKYIGMISEDNLLNMPDMQASIGAMPLDHAEVFINEYEHVFELIKKMIESNVFIMPVIGDEDQYTGIANAESVLRKLGSSSALTEPGGMLVLEMNKSDYSLSEIARIVESNDAQILNCFISSNHNVSQIEVTIKVNKTDLEDVIQSFERYEYSIKASYHQSSAAGDIQQRYESLMHYLNM